MIVGKLAIALVDIDNFKQVNDNYENACGGMVLVAVASNRSINQPQGVLQFSWDAVHNKWMGLAWKCQLNSAVGNF